MDVCPVGAITTRDYRFKSRPWDNPSAVDTICTLCEKGCNTTAWLRAKPEWAKGATLVRFTPRLNPDVNQFWMCDVGRFNYHWIESDQRLTRPIVSADQGQQAATWNQALDRASGRVDRRGGQGAVPALRARQPRGTVRLREVRTGAARRQGAACLRRCLDIIGEGAAARHEVHRTAGGRAQRRRCPHVRPRRRRRGNA